MEPYIYTPLDEDHLRVLAVVQPYVDAGDEIRCSMLSIPIDGRADYAALSYSWGMDPDGDASVCEHILVDGKKFGVTRNLLHGLRRIFVPPRDGDEFLPIWIDAVCIDQNNIDERNAQVARMAEIYSCATKVFVWLGEGTDYAESDGIAAVLDCLAQPVHLHYSEHVVTNSDGTSARLCLAHAGIAAWTAMNGLRTSGTKPPSEYFPTCLPRCIRRLFDPEELIIAIDEMERLLLALLTKRYWSRRWIIQEINHADHNETYILWADQVTGVRPLLAALRRVPGRFGWADVGRVLDLELPHWDNDQDISASINRVRNMLSLRNSVRMFERKNVLASAMQYSNGYNCIDPRDRLYALLSMDSRTGIRPDYRLSAHEVYAAFCTDLLQNEGLLPGLVYSAASQKTQSHNDDDISQSLPSWCLDLRERFEDLGNDIALGPCKVLQNRLICSVLVIGLYPAEGKMLDPVRAMSDGIERKRSTITYTYSIQCKPGDLLCCFRHVASSAGTITIPAIILQAQDKSNTSHRIAGLCLTQWTLWQPEDHELRTVTIC